MKDALPTAVRAERLPRRLGAWSAAAVLVGSTIGSGIFRVPSTVAAEIGTVGAIALVWLIGAAVALFGALTMAELSTLYPRSGGIYVFLREAYGPMPAFLFGWTELLVIRPSALGAVSRIFADYLGAFIPMGEGATRGVAAVAIVLLAAANIRSVIWASGVMNVATAAKVIALMFVVVLAFAFGNAQMGALAGPISFTPLSFAGFGIALVSVMWAYDGWADLTFMAGEVKNPARNLPRALLFGTGTVVVLYLLINAAYLYVLPIDAMVGSKLVAADAATRIFGAVGKSIVALLVMLSAFGTLNGSTMTGPRILYAMADDGLFFKQIAKVHPRFQTPYASIILCALLGVGYVSINSFKELTDKFILGIWPFYALAVGAVFLLRRKYPDVERPYRTWGYPIVPVVFLLASVAMLLNALVEQPVSTGIGFAIILLGIPVFYWRESRKGAQPEL
jgi:APA family basic amino acid/polyamine antiporter